jgi:5'-deoxynucleotidase YfbR-like HD superfamily hydrolase
VWLLWLLTEGMASNALLMAGIVHDLAEHVVGDMPAPTKRKLDGAIEQIEEELLDKHGLMLPLYEAESRLLNLADIYSSMFFCVSERALGNQQIAVIYDQYLAYVKDLNPYGIEQEILNCIDVKWGLVK